MCTGTSRGWAVGALASQLHLCRGKAQLPRPAALMGSHHLIMAARPWDQPQPSLQVRLMGTMASSLVKLWQRLEHARRQAQPRFCTSSCTSHIVAAGASANLLAKFNDSANEVCHPDWLEGPLMGSTFSTLLGDRVSAVLFSINPGRQLMVD